MKHIIYLLTLLLFVFNCSKDNNPEADRTFLEKYAGTVWVFTDYGEKTYVRIIDNLNHPFEYWEESGDCYDYYLEILDEEFYSVVDITKNSNNTFELEAVDTDGGMEFMLIMTISVFGNNLEMSYTYYEDGVLNETYSEYWAKVSMDVDSLPICDY
ncbi:hypothetical protein [Aestuariivivens sediminicola]|uniref:hypothetical protein n=1 Tax=Aestuariivivens sediminicola TaxID=2913560 RepID=UPI001F5ACE05|nr:hypothetical protein [Aestuariivivens sediminicola]